MRRIAPTVRGTHSEQARAVVKTVLTYAHLAADDLKRAHATRSPLDNL